MPAWPRTCGPAAHTKHWVILRDVLAGVRVTDLEIDLLDVLRGVAFGL